MKETLHCSGNLGKLFISSLQNKLIFFSNAVIFYQGGVKIAE